MAPEQFLRRVGYTYIRSRYDNSESFIRELSRNHYPRFHIHVKQIEDKVCFNLHLDQKRPSYPGVRMHNAEHEGEVIEMEIERLKNLLDNNLNSDSNIKEEVNKKKSWWRKIFNK